MNNQCSYRAGITNHNKSSHKLCIFWSFCILIANIISYAACAAQTSSASQAINIYLTLAPQNTVLTTVQQFKAELLQQKKLAAYSLQSFIDHYPLHITLYSTTYQNTQQKRIIKRIHSLAQEYTPLKIVTNQVHMTSHQYVMLNLIANENLQTLSNEVVIALHMLRKRDMAVPDWIGQDKRKLWSFYRFGSPHTFDSFIPHVSLLAAPTPALTAQQRRHYRQELAQFIKDFNQHHHKQTSEAIAIGIGIVNTDGQIIRELASFPLRSMPK